MTILVLHIQQVQEHTQDPHPIAGALEILKVSLSPANPINLSSIFSVSPRSLVLIFSLHLAFTIGPQLLSVSCRHRLPSCPEPPALDSSTLSSFPSNRPTRSAGGTSPLHLCDIKVAGGAAAALR